jgi:hypothetical protein
VKRSGRDEPVWVAIHKCMEATLRISLHRYLYLKLAKTLCLSYYPMFSLQQNPRARRWNSFSPKAVEEEAERRGSGTNNVYACK